MSARAFLLGLALLCAPALVLGGQSSAAAGGGMPSFYESEAITTFNVPIPSGARGAIIRVWGGGGGGGRGGAINGGGGGGGAACKVQVAIAASDWGKNFQVSGGNAGSATTGDGNPGTAKVVTPAVAMSFASFTMSAGGGAGGLAAGTGGAGGTGSGGDVCVSGANGLSWPTSPTYGGDSGEIDGLKGPGNPVDRPGAGGRGSTSAGFTGKLGRVEFHFF